jgi:hypothetical protein
MILHLTLNSNTVPELESIQFSVRPRELFGTDPLAVLRLERRQDLDRPGHDLDDQELLGRT